MSDYPIMEEKLRVFPSREKIGQAAGMEVVNNIRELHKIKEEVRIVFAAAPSQNELLSYLACSDQVEWNRVVAFHMDEYIGLKKDTSQLFSTFLNERLFSKVEFKKVNLINSNIDPDEEIKRYSQLVQEAPLDIICLGIGENGHIAFNDPHTADFNDKTILKLVTLDEKCRTQQVNDGCFPRIDDVPRKALTLSIPVLMSGKYLYCVVPGPSKKKAVYNTIHKPVSTQYPATILRKHPECRFYFDVDSYNQF